MSLSDEEFVPDQKDLVLDDEEFDEEWEDVLDLDETASQLSCMNIGSDTDASDITTTLGSAVWQYFDKNPSYAPGYNICKICSNRYRITTSISTLRKYLNKHSLSVPKKKYVVIEKRDPFDEEEQQIHDKYLTDWLICDLQPFTVVENHYFKMFINFFCPRYIIPDRHKAKDLIIATFTNRRDAVINELHKIKGKFALTADMWTSTINQEAFLGLTIHYVDSNWKLQNFLLDIVPFTVSHSGANMAREIMRTLEEFNISNKIVALTTDNESAMIVCGREIALDMDDGFSSMIFSHYRCAAHVLNLGVKEGLKLVNDSIKKARKLMNSIKNSTCLCDNLRLLCNLKEIKYLKPIIDVETRWNSTYYMLRRLEDTLLLLEPLEKATKYLSASSYSTMGETRFIFSGIQAHLTKNMENETFTQREMATLIHRKIRQYWMIMDKSSITSAILDPQNKLTIFSDESRLSALQHIQDTYNTYKEWSLLTNTKQYAPNSTRQYFARLQQINEEIDQTSDEISPVIPAVEFEELNRYLQLPIDEGTDPLTWWQAHSNEFPVLCNIARDFLCIQAMSVASEQAFSVAGNTITKTRNRLLPETARVCLCMKSWINNKLVK
ncbi:zinc finger BED domain-containing protein RICESLEEPER 2-like [Rhizophagus irregularis DAOM 181602=DAOM 197198]|nr:zinc finger BED domain-containing protein RICESLEEPER 2-like [Rhizophagus irregularis DAOM 181602=DAOM 197198]